ncbi:polysialyltransferase family glycosyltransferase [Streptomyces sp. NPDC014894]|uniref:polysialyltransferase family glycosyltransferase n=1 Tax=Streptomyces sp. NPDC014894 TaxID=3364931 RepID=UPI0036FBDA00
MPTTQIFYASSLYGVATLAAAIDSGCFAAADRRLLLIANNAQTPETSPGPDAVPGFERLRERFDGVLSWNEAIAPFHPGGWSPRRDDTPLWERYLRLRWGLGEDRIELAVESIQVSPALTIAQLFPDAPLDVYADGLMSYGPTRNRIDPLVGERVRRLLHPDLVPGLRPLLLAEFGAEPCVVPADAFRKVIAELADSQPAAPEPDRPAPAGPEQDHPTPAGPEPDHPTPAGPEQDHPTPAGPEPDHPTPAGPEQAGPDPGPGPRDSPDSPDGGGDTEAAEAEGPALLLGQYLAALGILTPEEEEELHLRMVRGAVDRGFRRLVFKPHPTAPASWNRALEREAARLGAELSVLSEPLLAEVVYRRARPSLVVGCFSTALLTAAAFYGLPVARVGTEELLDRLTPYQNSNRIPLTIVDAVVPELTGEDPPAPLSAEELTGLVKAVGFAMQSRIRPDLRGDAEDFLASRLDGRTLRYFKRRRLTALGLPGGVPAPRGAAVRKMVRGARRLRRAALR